MQILEDESGQLPLISETRNRRDDAFQMTPEVVVAFECVSEIFELLRDRQVELLFSTSRFSSK